MAELGRAALVVTLGLVPLRRRRGRLCSLERGAGGSRTRPGTRSSPRSARRSSRRACSPPASCATTSRSCTSPSTRTARCRGPYKLSAFWGGQEGSLLLWLLILTGYAALAVVGQPQPHARSGRLGDAGARRRSPSASRSCSSSSRARSCPGGAARRRRAQPEPAEPVHDGAPAVPLPRLRRPRGAVRVRDGGAALRRTDERWIVATRRWTLIAWTALGIGQLLGAHWAYVEVGWGGYYAWDPVENAALMPWLAATAFLHSVMIQEKRGMLKVWNMVLVALAFCLSLFGTFLTRSRRRQLDPLVRAERHRPVVPRLHRDRGRLLDGADRLAAAAAALDDEARVARLARGGVPLQQSAARRALPDDPLGRGLADPLGGGARARRSSSAGRTTTSSCASSACRCCC